MEGNATSIYISMEGQGQHLILDGSLALLSELFDTLRRPTDPRDQAAQAVRGRLERRGLLGEVQGSRGASLPGETVTHPTG